MTWLVRAKSGFCHPATVDTALQRRLKSLTRALLAALIRCTSLLSCSPAWPLVLFGLPDVTFLCDIVAHRATI